MERVTHKCSNPDCRVPTAAAKQGDGVTRIGEAAHICAASPGGPRFDSTMTTKQRVSIDNAIWLCANCSKHIDKDPSRYPVETLKYWKTHAEETARRELGKRPPREEDAKDLLTSVLSGDPKRFVPNAISNAHQATSLALQSLDPRFLVESSYHKEKTKFRIQPKENVSFLLNVDMRQDSDFLEKHRRLVEEGQDLEVRSDAIYVSGSRLLEEIFSEPGVLKIYPDRIPAIQKLWVVCPDTDEHEQFDDLVGFVSAGVKKYRFEGEACEGIFSFNYGKSLSGEPSGAKVNLSLDLSQWEGVDVRALPFFTKIISFFNKLADGWLLFSSLEIKGLEANKSEGVSLRGSEYILQEVNFLKYTERCRILAENIGCSLVFRNNVEFSAGEHMLLAEVVETLKGHRNFGEENLTSPASASVVAGPDASNIRDIAAIKEPANIQMVSEETERLNLFGAEVTLPRKVVRLNGVLPDLEKSPDDLVEGDTVKVTWVPQPGFRVITEYDFDS